MLWNARANAPGIENLRLNEEIKPESTTVYEAEAGYRIRGNRLEVTSVGTSGAEIAVTTGGVSVPPISVDYSPFGVVGQRIGFTCSGSRFTIFLSTGPITLRREPSPLS